MDDEIREKWLEAGSIAGRAREYGRTLVEPGVTFTEVAESIEAKVRELGAEPAFPVNISIDEDAAHDTAQPDDDRTFGDQDVVKLDIGAHIDGYIGDTATTIVLGDQGTELAEAARAALTRAMKVVRAGVNVKEIGQAIQTTIQSFGAKPISNLTGHAIERWTQHAGLSIPNVPHGDATLEAGQVIAIEPFATDGAGHIYESRDGGIYHFKTERRQRQKDIRAAMDVIKDKYSKLPFASRWLAEDVNPRRIPLAMKTLTRQGAIKAYGVLKEEGDGLVAQAEHTVIVTEDGCQPTTVVDGD